MPEELTLLPCPLCQATAHVEYHNGYLRVICEGEPGCPFRMGGKRFVFPDECCDCRNTCPAYFRGLHWHNLLKTLTTLCNALEKVDPQIAEIGTRVYERAA